MYTKIKLSIADDHLAIRKGLVSLLEEFDDIQVIACVSNGEELLQSIKHTSPDLVLVDIDMPIMNGFTFLEKLPSLNIRTRTLMFSMHAEDAMILKSVELGANGYLTKDSSAEEIHQAIIGIYEQGVYFTDKVSKLMIKKLTGQNKIHPNFNHSNEELSEREKELIQHLSSGLNSHQIGDKMCMSERTVEGIRHRLIKQLNVNNSVGLVMYGVRNGIVV